MPSGHGRDDYTLQRMLERRNRNNIRKVLERNGRRLTAREIDIVNLCTRYPDQRCTLFTYCCDANCMQLNPYVLPHLPVPDHHRNQHHQQAVGAFSNFDRFASTSFVAPLLLQMNVDTNAAHTDAQSQSGRVSTSRVTLPCYLLTDRPAEASTTSGIGINSTENLIADTIVESLKSSSDKGNSDKDSSDKGIHNEKGSSYKANSKKSSIKNSKKKKKKNKKKGRANAGPSETQTRSDNDTLDEPCSSNFSSSSHVEKSLVDGDAGDQVKSDTKNGLRCFPSNLSERCHGDVSYSNSMLSSDEREDTEPALLEILQPLKDATNEDPSALHEEMHKADIIQCSSDACISNDFAPIVSRRRGSYDRRFHQQHHNPSQFVAFSERRGDRFSAWQEIPSKIVNGDKFVLHKRYSKPSDSRIETSTAPESDKKTDTLGKQDSKSDGKSSPTKLPICSKKDHDMSGNVSKHSGEYVFKKDDFPSLQHVSSDTKVVARHKVGPRLPQKDDSKKLPSPFPVKILGKHKEPENEAMVDTKLSIPILEVKIGEVKECGIGSGSSSASSFSSDSCNSSQMNQSSHDNSGLDSPRISNASDETQLGPDICPSNTNDGHNATQLSHIIPTLDDKSTIDVAPSGCVTCTSNLDNDTPTDINPSKFGSSVCSCPTITTPAVPSTDMPSLDIGESKNLPNVCNTNLEEILRAVQAANKVHQIVELVQTTFGGPFADYELLCYYAAPAIDLPPRQIANVPLQKIWQWYEEPSCYALEVKGCQDHQRLIDFTAHFVPSLSAVQLFVKRGHSTIFAKHLPKKGEAMSTPTMEEMSRVGAGSAELVFEFFEYEQPYFRQTLFEKVKELVAGVAQGKSNIHGDAQNLKQLQFTDLHPASWYSVAWYPVYRIPEGRCSFKAAFLTYHSLAHFVQGIAGPSIDSRIAISLFPVVGLASYNTQEESWYHERYRTGGNLIGERLESLNLTAVVMSRAQVMRGGQVSENHHPDFEFFESRRYPN